MEAIVQALETLEAPTSFAPLLAVRGIDRGADCGDGGGGFSAQSWRQ
jgi:hypothetical protein